MDFELTPSELVDISYKTGFQKNPLEKVLRLIGVLNVISAHPELKDLFVLKGGTALNLFYYSTPRLSVDADLNYTRTLDKKAMLHDKITIRDLVHNLFSDTYKVVILKDEYALLQLDFHYDTLSGSMDRLKLDINFLLRQPMIDPISKDFIGWGQSITINVQGLEELIASKIIALLTRYTPRDLFDIYQTAMIRTDLDKVLLHTLVMYYGLISRYSIYDLFQPRWEEVSDYDIRRLLHPLLIRGHYPERETMVEAVDDFIQPLITLTNDEKATFDRFYKTGKLQIDGLFVSDEMRERIVRSPAYKWKKEHVIKSQKK